MDARALEKKLGMPLGATLTALVALAEEVAPAAPWDAFAPLWLRLPWLKPGKTARAMRCSTPKNVHPFAETGGDLNHFGFLLDGDMPTDERPIVFVAPKDDDEGTQIVAPNLRALLGLVAVAFAEVVSRDATDAEWASFRRDWYGDDAATLAEMERLSTLLCSIPGVARPASPWSVANAHPTQTFELDDDDDAPPDAQLDALQRSVRAARDRVLALAEGMVDGRVLDGATLAAARQDAASSLVAALRAVAVRHRTSATAIVASWKGEPGLWKALSRGAAADLDALLHGWIRAGHGEERSD